MGIRSRAKPWAVFGMLLAAFVPRAALAEPSSVEELEAAYLLKGEQRYEEAARAFARAASAGNAARRAGLGYVAAATGARRARRATSGGAGRRRGHVGARRAGAARARSGPCSHPRAVARSVRQRARARPRRARAGPGGRTPTEAALRRSLRRRLRVEPGRGARQRQRRRPDDARPRPVPAAAVPARRRLRRRAGDARHRVARVLGWGAPADLRRQLRHLGRRGAPAPLEADRDLRRGGAAFLCSTTAASVARSTCAAARSTSRPRVRACGSGRARRFWPCLEAYAERVRQSRRQRGGVRAPAGRRRLPDGAGLWQATAEARSRQDLNQDYWNNYADAGLGRRWRLSLRSASIWLCRPTPAPISASRAATRRRAGSVTSTRADWPAPTWSFDDDRTRHFRRGRPRRRMRGRRRDRRQRPRRSLRRRLLLPGRLRPEEVARRVGGRAAERRTEAHRHRAPGVEGGGRHRVHAGAQPRAHRLRPRAVRRLLRHVPERSRDAGARGRGGLALPQRASRLVDGPASRRTASAGCTGRRLEERAKGRRFDILLMQDAEDIVTAWRCASTAC